MNDQPLILSVETATMAGSVSISRGSNILAGRKGDPNTSHSNTLLADINELLNQVDLRISDVELFAVASGPGSFTGLRIGLATVKALASTLGRPCLGIPTLEAIAHSAGISDATVSLLPAGRGEVFGQLFSMSADGAVTALDNAAHLPPAAAIKKYSKRREICWAGDGAELYSDIIQEFAVKAGLRFVTSSNGDSEGWRIAAKPLNLAQHLASLAMLKLDNAGEQTANNLRAIYVRPSDAELRS